MIVYVIMENDFPAKVLSSKVEANALVDRKNREDEAEFPRRRIFWRWYKFELDGELG